MRPLRVLHLYSGNLFGGVETLLLTLAQEGPLEPGVEHSFALCFEGRLSQELQKAGHSPWFLGEVRLSRPWTVWRARRRLTEILRNETFDAVLAHSCWTMAALGAGVRRARVPLGFWLHDFIQKLSRVDRWASWIKPDWVVCNSDFTRSSLERLYPSVPAKTFYSPVAAPRELFSRDQLREQVRQELGISSEQIVLLQASRLEPWKGHHLHLQTLACLKADRRWVSVIAGGPQKPGEKAYFQELKDLAIRIGISDRVHWLGQRKDVSQLLRAADIHFQPNEGGEPFGIVFIEALLAQLPVVTTALGGACEIVNASCGRLVTPEPLALAEELKNLMDDESLRRRLGSDGPVRAGELCNPQRQLTRLRDLLEAWIAGARGKGHWGTGAKVTGTRVSRDEKKGQKKRGE